MCMKGTCATCRTLLQFWFQTQSDVAPEKSSWFGCGSHIPKVMDAIPKDQWCTCKDTVEVNGVQYPPKAAKVDM